MTRKKGLVLGLESKSEIGWQEHDTKLLLRKILKTVMTEVSKGSVWKPFLLNNFIDSLSVLKSLMLIKYYWAYEVGNHPQIRGGLVYLAGRSSCVLAQKGIEIIEMG